MTVQFHSVRDILLAIGEPWTTEEGLNVPTTTLLPGGELAKVVIRADEGGKFVVSDNGAGREAALNKGILAVGSGAKRRARKIAEASGLQVDGDAFVLRHVTEEQLASAVSYVADASRVWAEYIVEQSTKVQVTEVTQIVREKLENAYSARNVKFRASVLGASTTQYEFDFAVEVEGNRTALFEIVSPSIQSIAFAHTKFSDVARAHDDWPREAIVEDLSQWSSDYTSLLAQVATRIRSAREDWPNLPRAA